MKRIKKFSVTTVAFFIIATVISFCFFSFPIGNKASAENAYRAIYVMDYDTGTVVKNENENSRYPIASMVKIMTLLLAFEEIDAGKMTFTEKVAISDYAASMGGSQLFLDAGKEYPVCDLIKGVTVCSANDAAVALGERISGDNDSFVSKMNKRAQELGMKDTLFCNATGLPDSGEQYSTAKDVTTMMRSLLMYPKYYDFTRITVEDYVHPDGRKTQMVNTNKLIRSYSGCDAGKTGFTNEAMFCLSSSAKRGDTRVIVTVLGCPDSKTRFRTVSDTFSGVFANYETKNYIRKGDEIACDIRYPNAKTAVKTVVCDKDLSSFGKKGESDAYSLSISFDESIKAPISTNTPIGKVSLVDKDGNIIESAALYSAQNIDKRGFFDNFKHIIQNWEITKK